MERRLIVKGNFSSASLFLVLHKRGAGFPPSFSDFHNAALGSEFRGTGANCSGRRLR